MTQKIPPLPAGRDSRTMWQGPNPNYPAGMPCVAPSSPRTSPRVNPLGKCALGGLGDLVRLQAARADVDAPGAATLLLDADLLEVRVEAPPGRDHRVASRVPEGGTLAAAV